ncbi:MAG: ferrochelatase [Planctomycetes bacterium]|nr:ferrochelatase [Planctomycetota bacterium]
MSQPRWGLLLINLGTPDAPTPSAVRRYLAEFLDDPRVIDMAAWKRWALLNLVILPRRPKQAAHAYTSIWDAERGSPLKYHSEDLCRALQASLGDEAKVILAMRYQSPTIAAALETFRAEGIDQIVALPLFPQYASSSTGSALEKLYLEAGKLNNVPQLTIVPPFYEHPAFIRASAAIAKPVLAEADPQRVLFSFHSLPERHIRASDFSTGCLASESCCDQIGDANRFCYRAHCYATARALAAALELAEGTWEVAFQSRLTRDPWVKPHTDARIEALGREGLERLVVLEPSFTADCLETLEEIGIRGAKDFRSAGGGTLTLVPSLNASAVWVEAVEEIVREHVPHRGVSTPR